MTWKHGFMTAGLALLTSGVARAQAPAPATSAPRPAADRPAGDVPGPIDNLNDLQETGRMMFKMADTNNDGQISQKEAVDAANLTVGGFFFRADQNGDGVLSQDEARQAREALFAQQPMLRYLATKGRAAAAAAGAQPAAGENANNAGGGTQNPAQAIGHLLDSNNDKQIQATEVRQAVQTGVQGMFAVADTNRDGQLSPTEINAAIIGVARTAAQAAFQQADADHNGALSRDEFNHAIVQPADIMFGILDANGDGQISAEESQAARRIIASQLRHLMVPEPANSPRNLIRTGVSPDQISPVPGPAPAPGGQPRQ